MRHYEMVYIINPNLEAESLKEVVDKFSDIVNKLKGTIIEVNEWGKRKLAYEIKKFDKGYYVLLDFCGLPAAVKELERNLKLDERVLKYLNIKLDEEIDPEELISKVKESAVEQKEEDVVLEDNSELEEE
ncbi:MAG: 30S ribosomal protein S6 [Thermodesulfobacteriota bacterium]|nr:30S ribosomal protein S6 [Thermodesulfobacteriota bacterium]